MVEGRLCASWIQRLEPGGRLVMACRSGGAWGAPRTIVSDARLFVNWADFPSVLPLDDGRLAAHWLRREQGGTYAYHAWVAFSEDGGATWGPGERLHDDLSPQEHGFVSLVPAPGGGLDAIWLDGRAMVTGGNTQLRSRRYHDGAWGEEQLLDERVCDCCQTAAVRGSDGDLLAVYRDRSDDEIRDLSAVRGADDRWHPPASFSDEGWRIAGCPVQGPALDADGDRIAAVWYSSPEEGPVVRFALSEDSGRTFSTPAPVAAGAGEMLGRVDVVWHRDEPHAAWFRREGESMILQVASMGGSGAEEIVELARLPLGRSSGFPRMVSTGDRLWVAWTDPEEAGGGVRLASLP